MGRRTRTWLSGRSRTDWAILYVRLFLGGSVLLHNVGKLYRYNEIIDSYPSILHLNGAASFALVACGEVLLALLLIIGYRVRFVAGVMVAGLSFSLVYALPAENPDLVERLLLMAGMSVVPLISGGGVFSLDAVLLSDLSTRNNQ